MIRVPIALEAAAESNRHRIAYALQEMATRVGLAFRLVSDSSKGVRLMGPDAELYHDPRAYRRGERFKGADIGGRTLWVPAEWEPGCAVDHVGSVYRLLLLHDEAGVKRRNRLGVFETGDLPEARRALTSAALVENHVLAFCEETGLQASTVGWPEGKAYCVLLTHDTDAGRLGALPEIALNLVKGSMRLDRRRLQLVRAGLGVKLEEDPYFTFPVWSKVLAEYAVPSAFYLSVAVPGRRGLHDVRSDVLDYPTVMVDRIRAMAESGSEIGLHAAIGSKDDIDIFLHDKARIESEFGPVFGVRHHYWSIDWREPFRTYRMHENAGFRYDMSMAWHDSVGFRPGTALPYRPFDPVRRRPLDLYVIPTAVLDDHVVSKGSVEGHQSFADVKDEARRVGGILCLDWHTESACGLFPYLQHLDTLRANLQSIVDDNDAWITTPWELVQFWHDRYCRFAVDAKSL